jgi:pyruvate-formate lyase-activating enzyme
VSTYCPLPFRHVFVEPRGIKPCCSYTRVTNVSIDQWIAGNELKQIQQNILSGTVDPGCAQCIRNEQQHGTSTRLGALKDYEDRVDSTEIDYIDYRSSNVCNFKCRTCEPFFSNGIAADVKRSEFLQSLYQVPPEKTATVTDKNWIISHLPQIKRLMFTGGEPTLLPEVREIIDLVRTARLDTNIQIITNGSFRDHYWLEIARDMPNVNFTVSIDAVGPTAEIIRHGTDWAQVEHNIRWLAEHGHSLNFSTVISRLNLFQLGPLLAFTRDIRKNYHKPNGRTQFIQLCNYPDYLNPINWPWVLTDSAWHYIDALIKLEDHEPTVEILTRLSENIKTHVYDPDLWEKGERYNIEINGLRNQNHAGLYQPSF